jgi:polysaccharide pyruvyl transferase WcaK-like protein
MSTLQFVAQDVKAVTKLARGEHLAPYIGLVGYNNLGDELLYEAHQKLFPSHSLEPYRKDTLIVEKIGSLIGRPLCSHGILGGGTLINDGDIWLSKTEQLLNKGTKMFCLGTGVANPEVEARGPASILPRWVKALDRFEFVGVRGPHSKATLDQAGAKGVVITGDTALSMAADTVESTSSRGIVGLNYGDVPGNPMWGNPDQYRTELIKVIRSIISSGSKVRLLPVWNEDIPSNKALIETINHPDFTMVEAFDSYQNYANQLRQCDIFIGQKLHATIMALMNRVPSIMLEYRSKCRDFMASIELEKYIIKTSDLKLSTFTPLYEDLQKNHASIKSHAESRILEYKHQQLAQAKRLEALLAHNDA